MNISFTPLNPILIDSAADFSNEMERALVSLFGDEDFFVEGVSAPMRPQSGQKYGLVMANVRDADNKLHLVVFKKQDNLGRGFALPPSNRQCQSYPPPSREEERKTESAPVVIQMDTSSSDQNASDMLEMSLTANPKSVESISESMETERLRRELENETKEYDKASEAMRQEEKSIGNLDELLSPQKNKGGRTKKISKEKKRQTKGETEGGAR